jgi:hypothetical protein
MSIKSPKLDVLPEYHSSTPLNDGNILKSLTNLEFLQSLGMGR